MIMPSIFWSVWKELTKISWYQNKKLIAVYKSYFRSFICFTSILMQTIFHVQNYKAINININFESWAGYKLYTIKCRDI